MIKGKTAFFVGWGLALWLGATIFFRLLGHFLLDPANPVLVVVTFVATVPVIAAATYPAYALAKMDSAQGHQRSVAAVCIALPGMLLDVLSLSFFSFTFPNLSDLSAGALFGAWLLWAYSLILSSGFLRRRSP